VEHRYTRACQERDWNPANNRGGMRSTKLDNFAPRDICCQGELGDLGAVFLHVFCEGRESEMPAPSRFDHVSTRRSNSTRSTAAHPCKERKDGAPSVGLVHAKGVKDGPPAEVPSGN